MSNCISKPKESQTCNEISGSTSSISNSPLSYIQQLQTLDMIAKNKIADIFMKEYKRNESIFAYHNNSFDRLNGDGKYEES